MVKKSILTDTPNNLIKRYFKVLTDHGIKVSKIILFGSYAKNNAKPWSDVDICVVSEQFGKNGYDEMVRLNQLTTDVDTMLEVHPYHPKDLDDPYDPLAHEIKLYGKVII